MVHMRRIRLTVAYDGTDYCGWQVQPNGITVEEVLNKAVSKLTGEDIHVIGQAVRTPACMHWEMWQYSIPGRRFRRSGWLMR